MTLPPLLIWFGVGMALATVSVWAAAEPGPDGPVRRFCRSVAASPGMCALIAGCAFAIACTPVACPQFTNFVSGLWPTEIKSALYTIVAAAVVAPVAFRHSGPLAPVSRPVRVLGSRVPRFLGKISYGIFLWQFLAAYAFFAVFHLKTGFTGGSYNAAEVAAIGLAIAALTIAAATASYYLIEQPAQQFATLAGTVRGQPRGDRRRAACTPGPAWGPDHPRPPRPSGIGRQRAATSRPMMIRQMTWGMTFPSPVTNGPVAAASRSCSPAAAHADAASSSAASSAAAGAVHASSGGIAGSWPRP